MAEQTKRGEAISQERRRRDTDALGGSRKRLSVSGDLDTANYTYRWVNDEPGRIEDMTTRDDWNVVSDRDGELKNDGAGTGAEVAVQAGRGAHGQAVRAILLRKRKDWQEADDRAKQRHIDEQEASIRAGATPGAGTEGTYTPRNGIQLEHGTRA